ncbi:hypothetical protein [Rossellomorea marisflavi]|uniref:hypothetical protein n=1 Tax=Rossellomorea marisflavi TaxID=189381 RepID=UPI0009A89D0F|nr:hypothetical protein [Rossellomorea marisflavi]
MAKISEVKIGDTIKITDKGYSAGLYKNGDVFTVESFYSGLSEGVIVKELSDIFIGPDEFEVIQAAPTPQVGDIVVFNGNYCYLTEGKPYAITHIDSDGILMVDDDDGDELAVDDDMVFTVFKPVSMADQKPVYVPQIGDIVKVNETGAYNSSHKEGDIGEVVEIDRVTFRVNTASATISNWVKAWHVTLVTKAEDRADNV